MILLSPCVISISYKLLLYRKVKLLPVALSYNKDKTAYPRNLGDDLIDKIFPPHEYNPNENLNVRKMYMLYTENYLELNILTVKEHTCRYIFNMRFKIPWKDTCKKCNEYKIKLDTENKSRSYKKSLLCKKMRKKQDIAESSR